MRIIAIIQARMGSLRLPGKTLMKINGKALVEIVANRIKKASGIDKIIVATSNTQKDDPVAEFLKEKKIEVFRGHETDLLKRYYDAAAQYKADIIIRICGDQPLVDPQAIDLCLQKHLQNSKADFTYCKHPKGWPDGTGCEIISWSALQRAQKQCTDSFEREHIQPFFLNHQTEYTIETLDAPPELYCPNIHLAIDTKADFDKITKIYQELLFKSNANDDKIISIMEVTKKIKEETINNPPKD
jgi:spore coat polysaccharide biosynthesis protein SpsF